MIDIDYERIRQEVEKHLKIEGVILDYKSGTRNTPYGKEFFISPSKTLCLKCNTVSDKESSTCPSCKFYLYESGCLTSENAYKKLETLVADMESYARSRYLKHSHVKNVENILYVSENESNGLRLSNVNCTVFYNQETQKIDYQMKETSFVDFQVGQKCTAYKKLKTKDSPINIFELLRLNSSTVKEEPVIVFNNADNLFEFLKREELSSFNRISQLTKLLNILYNDNTYFSAKAIFKAYIALMSEFPQFELLYKMGCYNLFQKAINSILSSQNLPEMKTILKEMQKIIDNEATKGKQTIRIPSYISDYLNKKNAELSEFLAWCDIYELTNISKENFEDIINSTEFAYMMYSTRRGSNYYSSRSAIFELLIRALKYGYDLEKLIRYMSKQFKKSGTLQILVDYLEICEFIGAEKSLYPEELKARHDDVMQYKKQVEDTINAQKLFDLGTEVEKHLLSSDYIKKNEDYTVVIPKSVTEFFDEGNRMNNCVGHYSRSVLQKQCIIFFVRLKDKPDEGYITAEYLCNSGKLGQFFYKNNRYVDNKSAHIFGDKVCKLIKEGISKGKINL